MTNRASVVLAFDHPVLRAGLKAILMGEPFEVVAESTNLVEMAADCRTFQPQLLVTDNILDSKDVFDILAQLPGLSPSTRTVILSVAPEPIWIARSIAWGAHDFLLRSASREEILTSLQRARDGIRPPEGSRWAKTLASMQRRTDFPKTIPAMTGREMQTVRLLAFGLSNQEIARTIQVKLETAKEHVLNAMRKLDVADRTQAAVLAIQNGWLNESNKS
ncbi:MAG: response regulator transcription factor [Planctomycetaceae bacterium]|nr:response regulator transcription factor [Planctomycetaceae bacterium]